MNLDEKDRLVCRVETLLLSWGRVLDWRGDGNSGVPGSGDSAGADGLMAVTPLVQDQALTIEMLMGQGKLVQAGIDLLAWVWIRRSRGIRFGVFDAVKDIYGGHPLPGSPELTDPLPQKGEGDGELRAVAKVWERTIEGWKVWAGGELAAGRSLGCARDDKPGELAARHAAMECEYCKGRGQFIVRLSKPLRYVNCRWCDGSGQARRVG